MRLRIALVASMGLRLDPLAFVDISYSPDIDGHDARPGRNRYYAKSP
jgi:hypothetical protein